MKTTIFTILTFGGTILMFAGGVGTVVLLFIAPLLGLITLGVAAFGAAFLAIADIMKEQDIMHDKIDMIMAAMDIKVPETDKSMEPNSESGNILN